jgi:hypothetical protein
MSDSENEASPLLNVFNDLRPVFPLVNEDGEKNHAHASEVPPNEVRNCLTGILEKSEMKQASKNLLRFTKDKYAVIFRDCEDGIPDINEPAELFCVVCLLLPFFVMKGSKIKLLKYQQCGDDGSVQNAGTSTHGKAEINTMFGSCKVKNKKGKVESAVKWFLESHWVIWVEDMDKFLIDNQLLDQLDPTTSQRANLSPCQQWFLENAMNPAIAEADDSGFCLQKGGMQFFAFAYVRYLRRAFPDSDDLKMYEKKIATDRQTSPPIWGSLKTTFSIMLDTALGGARSVAAREARDKIFEKTQVLATYLAP